MNKIPVGQTITYAYRFTFGQIGTIIGLCWVPLVLMAVLQFLPYALGGNPMATPENATALGRQELQSLATSLLVLLLYAIVCVPVTRQALGLRHGGAVVHFTIGMPEFRAFGALILFFIMIEAMSLGMRVLGLVLESVVRSSAGGALAGFLIAIAMVAAFAGFIYVIARLGFVLLPVTVAENQVSLTRAWILTRGNFWRIVGVAVSVLLPLYLVYVIGLSIIVAPDLAASGTAISPAQAFAATLHAIGRHMPEYLGLTLILAPFNIGLSLGASAFAYRALVPAPGLHTAAPAA